MKPVDLTIVSVGTGYPKSPLFTSEGLQMSLAFFNITLARLETLSWNVEDDSDQFILSNDTTVMTMDYVYKQGLTD